MSIERDIGFVHEICPVGGLDDAAEPTVDAILRNGPIAVSKTKEMIGIYSAPTSRMKLPTNWLG